MTSPLFKPFTFKSLTLPNRIVMAPMTRSFAPEGVVGGDVRDYYARRAKAAVGMIITEGVVVERPAAKNDPKVPHFYGDAALKGWENVLQAVKKEGGLIAPQLWHVGMRFFAKQEWQPPKPYDSPSGIANPEKPAQEAPMSDEAIADTIAAFARAAGHAKRLGFQAIELHGAHGYLIDQFFWHKTNRRGDSYGGETIQERARFAADILRAVRREVGADFPVIIRLSQWKSHDFAARLAETPHEMELWLSPLVDAGADILHCSQRRFWEAEFHGSELNFAGWAKKLTGLPTITVGSVGLSGEFIAAYGGESSKPAPLDALYERLEKNEFDLVAVGRALLSDPEWALKMRDGRVSELKDFNRDDFATLY